MNQTRQMDDVRKFFRDWRNSLRKKRNTKRCKIVVSVVCVLMLFVSAGVLFSAIKHGGTVMAETYKDVCEEEREAVYQEQYEIYRAAGEERHHVSNRVSIYVGNLQEEQRLEVLKVSDVEFIIENREDNSYNIVSWLEVPGEGTFVVDLKAGEYIIDEERANVLVRVPYPELDNVCIDYANVRKILFKNDIFNESYKIGEELAGQQLARADMLLKKEFTSNQNYYINAQETAKHTIEALIRQLNPEVPNLTVDVEFYDREDS